MVEGDSSVSGCRHPYMSTCCWYFISSYLLCEIKFLFSLPQACFYVYLYDHCMSVQYGTFFTNHQPVLRMPKHVTFPCSLFLAYACASFVHDLLIVGWLARLAMGDCMYYWCSSMTVCTIGAVACHLNDLYLSSPWIVSYCIFFLS